MKALLSWTLKKSLILAGVTALLVPFAAWAKDAPKAAITLKGRHGHGVPQRCGCTHTGGGNIIVEQAKDDTVVITLAGVAVAGPHPHGSQAGMQFNVDQHFEISFTDEKVKKGKLTIDAIVVGLLRGDKHGGCASVDNGAAGVTANGSAIVSIALDPHSVCGCDNLSINDHVGPITVPVLAGDYVLNQVFSISANHSRGLFGKAASAEFAPDPALDPLWISYWEPFHGAAKKDFGFKVILHVDPD